ncbi:MAG: site-specific DNA-methyltransferase [Gallionella sp.]|nr:site-specific DNA-methyltransferase [Gallionella sp.]
MAGLFPNCVTESKNEDGTLKRIIDFDQLRQELSIAIVEGPQERYQLNWPGKREALLTANAPIAKTLRPCREESVDFDTTQNLFIEGDNLDALKLLQETYLNKVKMIYIDPPYNTGKDFIYEDDFAEDAEAYFQRSNQKDEEGNRLVANTEANGRFHSDWLTMMYPRLKLARNLLRNDGVIFISIDENEITNLRRLCDEVFGEGNFVAVITLLCNPKGRSQDKYFATNHEYVLVYSKTALPKGSFSIEKDENQIEAEYPEEDSFGKYRLLELRNTHREFGKHNRKNLFYPFYVDDEGSVSVNSSEGWQKVLPLWDDGYEGCWTWEKKRAEQDADLLFAKRVNDRWKIYRKSYANGADRMLKTILVDKAFYTERGQKEFNSLFNTKAKLFQSPKSPLLISQLCQTATSESDIVLDFFSGSATTAHAVMALNAEDGKTRRHIVVQLPAPIDEKSEAFKAGYKTIVEIGKERIRRAGKKIKEENAGKPGIDQLDIGFRVLKIDNSNMKDVYYAPDAVQQGDLLAQVDNIREDRSAEDLLFQVLLDWGVDLALPITQETIAGKQVFFVDGNALAACFETGIDEEFVKALAARHPLRAVFRDAGFGSDSVKINIEQIFKLISPTTEVKSI